MPSAAAPSVSGNSDSFASVISADGNFVLFTSQAGNLVTNDRNGPFLDVFLRNMTNDQTVLVSVTPDGLSSGNGSSTAVGISTNNRYVLFESRASNLVPNDTNNASDIFLRDIVNQTTALVSVNRFGAASGKGGSSNPVMTPDGRYVAFESVAADLVDHDTNGVADVFVRDMETDVTKLVTVNSNGVYSANGASANPALSADGRVIAFVSSARNLAPGNHGVTNQLYVRDLSAAVTRMIDLWRPEIPSVNIQVSVYSHVVSADGDYLAFLADSSLTNYIPAGIYYADLSARTNFLVAANLYSGNTVGRPTLQGPVMSADGQVVAFEARGEGASLTPRAVFVWDARTGNVELISTNTILLNGAPVPFGTSPVISADGNTVGYLSYTTNDPPQPNDAKLQLFARDRAAAVTKLVTVDRNGGPGSDAQFPAASLSGDGRWIVFQSRDGNLVAGDDNLAYDVFARDLLAARTALVSQREDASPSLTGFGNSAVVPNGLSADGRFLVFVSEVANLVANDQNDAADVFVRDLMTQSNILVSVDTSGVASGNGVSRDLVISANGRYVAFVSAATNLTYNDTNGLDDVFLRDLLAGTTVLVSVNRDHTASANGSSSKPSVSADGRLVAFQSKASDLVDNDVNGQPDIFVYDSAAASNRLVSVNFSGTGGGGGPSDAPVLAPDGRRVVFQSKAPDLLESPVSTAAYQFYARDLIENKTAPVSRGASFVSSAPTPGQMALSGDGNWVAFVGGVGSPLFLCDLRAETNTPNVLVATNATVPSLSGDGRAVAYQGVGLASNKSQIWVLDRQTGSTALASSNGTGASGGDGDSTSPVVSADGRFVIFKSRADDLVGNDTNSCSDVFARDVVLGITYILSVGPSGGVGDQLSASPLLGADGRTAVFQSFAGNLVEGDRNNRRDVFLVRLGAGDSDGDGMADDWEVTYFGDLSRDGSGDFDGDGLSDLAEYRAGTNPLNDSSVLRVLTITAVVGGETTLVWSAVSGKDYRVQYKDHVANPWANLATGVTISGFQGRAIDTAGDHVTNRFYRVVALP